MRLDESTFLCNRQRAIDYLNTLTRIYVVDGFAGWDKKHRIKLGDFGIARRIAGEEGSVVKGTTKYMAPEVAELSS